MSITLSGAWLAAKVGGKMNAKANADVRSSAELERIAAALETMALTQTENRYDATPLPDKRRKITAEEDKFLSEHMDACRATAYVGYDNKIHPDYCHP